MVKTHYLHEAEQEKARRLQSKWQGLMREKQSESS
jgi:hypothetical protein